MRIPARAQLLRWFRCALCAAAILVVLPPAALLATSAHAAETSHHTRSSRRTTRHAVRVRVYRVRRGDTLSGIAARYGVSMEQLRRWNHLRGNSVRTGQRLRINAPGAVTESAGTREVARSRREATRSRYSRREIARRRVYRRIYRVRPGDTLDVIAHRHGVSVEQLRRWNRLRGSYIRVGQRLYIREPERFYRHRYTARELARSRRLERAFVASSQLRPMAQQLITVRSPEAYAGVAAYARAHSGDAAAAAYLALGHAYLLDHRYTDAIAALQRADRQGTVLDDFSAFLTAQAYLGNNDLADAQTILASFAQKFPDSIFVPQVPVLQANLYIQQKNPQAALAVLNAHQADPIANRADFQLALAQANQLAGNAAAAQRIYKHIYLDFPLSRQATQARAQLAASGVLDSMPASERARRADALFDRGRYSDAEQEYRSLARSPSFSAVERNAMLVAAAACQWKLHTLTRDELERLPDTSDEAGARRLQLLMELARDRGDASAQQALVTQLAERFPHSPWFAQALYSSGNMYLLLHDYPNAIRYYSELAQQFPHSSMAPLAHWHAAWLNYRLGNYSTAATLMDEQIARYPDSPETAAALYWRARIYDGPGHNPGMAVKYYRKLASVYCHYYYADLARKRLADMGFAAPSATTGDMNDPPADPPPSAAVTTPDAVAALQREDIPDLSADIPEQDPHLVAAHLLANAGLNEYIAPEIEAADGSDQWGSLAQAEIYASYGETWRALHFMKRALPFYTAAPINDVPMAYWRILFPTPYWSTIKQAAAANNLDPYMVASLIRQESEFNPGAVSYANAYGLMQLLPSVGRKMARELGMRYFRTRDLLDPVINIRLGCRYLRQMLDATGDQPEYAFAAYNAGANRVAQWKSQGPYTGMDEFVASIPFTQTRNYVQAIVRNENIYRELDQAGNQTASAQ